MRRRGTLSIAAVMFVVGALLLPASVVAQAQGTENLGSFQLKRDVIANGQKLPAGSYVVRAADLPVKPVVGQTPSEYRWVEFLQGGDVKGREIAVVLAGPQAAQVIKSKGPAAGGVRVETLKGNEYVRVWINRGGQNYLVHLATGAAAQ